MQEFTLKTLVPRSPVRHWCFLYLLYLYVLPCWHHMQECESRILMAAIFKARKAMNSEDLCAENSHSAVELLFSTESALQLLKCSSSSNYFALIRFFRSVLGRPLDYAVDSMNPFTCYNYPFKLITPVSRFTTQRRSTDSDHSMTLCLLYKMSGIMQN